MDAYLSAEIKLYVKEENERVLNEVRDIIHKADNRRLGVIAIIGTFFSIFIAILSWFVSQGSVSSAVTEKLTDAGVVEIKNKSKDLLAEISDYRDKTEIMFDTMDDLMEKIREKGIVIPSGTILSFEGSMEEAESTFDAGWIICDGRKINHPLASPKFKDKRTPNLKDRFLLGGTASGVMGGKNTETTDLKGGHQHGRIRINPMKTPYTSNRWFGDDGGDNTFRNSTDGQHDHEVTIIPPYYTIIYLVYVL